MNPSALLRVLTPVGWCLLAGGVVIAAATLGHGLGLRWDPFDGQARRLERAEARADVAVSDAAARRIESSGRADQARRLDHFHQQTVAVERATVLATTQARSAPDASTPLDPARADRLADHDRELCGLVAAVCITAAADPAGDGDTAVPTGTSS